jgi:TonB family protein
MKFRLFLSVVFVASFSAMVVAATQTPVITVAVLDFGASESAEGRAESFAELLKNARGAEEKTKIALVDPALARLAARGAGYNGSLNMTLTEARDLGAAIGSRFFIIGDRATLRRSSISRPLYYEAYVTVFVVSAQSGRLVFWDRPTAESSTAADAEQMLTRELSERVRERYAREIVRAAGREETERFQPAAINAVDVIDLSLEESNVPNESLREPVPYRRLKPNYPESAERAEAEATVDASVEIDARGKVGKIEIVRWAGFGLDDAVVQAIRQMHFRPAARDGVPVPARVLLRYNFRKPEKAGQD